MENIWGLSRGESGVAASGATEWFETFFDWFPYEGDPDWYPAMTAEEESAVRDVCKLMQQAIADTDISKHSTVEEIVQTGWPARIVPTARHALDVMVARGRFSEDEEEAEPTSPVPWI